MDARRRPTRGRRGSPRSTTWSGSTRTSTRRVVPVPVSRWPKPSQSSSTATPSRSIGRVSRRSCPRGWRRRSEEIRVHTAGRIELLPVQPEALARGSGVSFVSKPIPTCRPYCSLNRVAEDLALVDQPDPARRRRRRAARSRSTKEKWTRRMWATLESASASAIRNSKSWRREAPAPPSATGMRRLPSPARRTVDLGERGLRSAPAPRRPRRSRRAARRGRRVPGSGCSRSAVVAICPG